MPLWPSSSKHRTCAPDMLFTQTIKSQNVAKPHSSGEETLWHTGRTCPDSGLHCGIGSHCLTDSCRKNEKEEEEEKEEEDCMVHFLLRKTFRARFFSIKFSECLLLRNQDIVLNSVFLIPFTHRSSLHSYICRLN